MDGLVWWHIHIHVYTLKLRSLVLREPHYYNKKAIQSKFHQWILLSLILSLLLIFAVNTTIKWVMPHETFTTPVCKSPLTVSRAPYWMINGITLNDTTVNSRYSVEVRRLGGDSRGRHQAQLIVHSVNKTLNGSNITCAVVSELRMVFILYIVPGMYVCMCRVEKGYTMYNQEYIIGKEGE